MNRIVRAAVAAVASLGLVSMAPVVTAASAPAPEVHKSAPTFKVTAAIDKTEVVAGEDTVRITGRVRPKAAGEKVVLQQRLSGSNKWVKSGKATIKPSGTLRRSRTTRAGPASGSYRVLKPPPTASRPPPSRELQLDVWGWEHLTVARRRGQRGGRSLGGYTRSARWATTTASCCRRPARTGYVEYTLGKKCRSLRATYALTDDSATGASGIGDGLGGRDAGEGPPVRHRHDRDGRRHRRVQRLPRAVRLRAARPPPAGKSAVGDPEVLCLP